MAWHLAFAATVLLIFAIVRIGIDMWWRGELDLREAAREPIEEEAGPVRMSLQESEADLRERHRADL
jgi:hypothetical protein